MGEQARDYRLYEDESPWQKYGHQILGAGMLVCALATIWTPAGLPTVIAWAGLVGTTVADAAWSLAQGDKLAAALDVGSLVVPVLVGKAIRFVRVGPGQLPALASGGQVEAFGQAMSLDEHGLLAVTGAGKAAPHVQIDPAYGLPMAEHGTLSAERAKAVAKAKADAEAMRTQGEKLPPDLADPDALYGYDRDGAPLSVAGYESRYVTPSGGRRYPFLVDGSMSDGGIPATLKSYPTTQTAIDAGAQFVDRVGDPHGAYLAVQVDGRAATWGERSLPIDSLDSGYHQYELAGPLPAGWEIETSVTAPAFGQPGGATQMRVLDQTGEEVTVPELLENGVLEPR